jgi:hypothetical protein
MGIFFVNEYFLVNLGRYYVEFGERGQGLGPSLIPLLKLSVSKT